MISAKPTINLFGGMVGVGLILLLAFATGGLMFVEVPANNQNALLVVIGILSANVGTMINFYYGSSAAEKKQGDSLANASNALAKKSDTDASITLAPGQSATTTTTDDGTVIETKP